jgi:hypothetical protein
VVRVSFMTVVVEEGIREDPERSAGYVDYITESA